MYFAIILLGIGAGIISGVVGTGASIILLPALTYAFGPKAAIPIMAIAAIIGNLSRVIMWRKEIHIKAFLLYSVPGVPAAILGSNTLWIMPITLSNLLIGLFFFILIPARHWAKSRNLRLNHWQLALSGALIGYLTGVVFSTGPLTIPIFSGYGLSKGALLSTESISSFSIYFAKASTFGFIGALPWSVVLLGLLIGATLALGIYIGKGFVVKISEKKFNYLIDLMMLIAGISMLWEVFK